MKLESDPSLGLSERQPAAWQPLVWLVCAAALAVLLLVFAPVPPM